MTTLKEENKDLKVSFESTIMTNDQFIVELERRWNAIVWKNQNYKASVLPVYERLKEQLTKQI